MPTPQPHRRRSGSSSKEKGHSSHHGRHTSKVRDHRDHAETQRQKIKEKRRDAETLSKEAELSKARVARPSGKSNNKNKTDDYHYSEDDQFYDFTVLNFIGQL